MSVSELKNAKKVIGAKQTVKAIEKGLAVAVFLAVDADQRLLLPVREACARENVPVDGNLTMHELGKACGIEVGAAAVACVR